MCLTDGQPDRQVQYKFSSKYNNICYRTVQTCMKKMWHANLRAWNGRAIMANNKLNCVPYQMTNVVNFSLRCVHSSERKNQVLLHGFVETTMQIHLLQG